MINRDEIVNKSDELGVHTSHVQRDYVFGWILAGIYTVSDLKNRLVLKGGNCLRKAYLDSVRYSPDLDFTTAGALTEEYIASELNRVCDFVEQHSGVHFVRERTRVARKRNIDSTKQVHEARLYFKDFFGQAEHIVIKTRLDVTQFDKMYLPVQTRELIHPYSDRPLCSAPVKCLKLEELLAAKLKCLLQRRHSADLYDFVCPILINPAWSVNQNEIVNTFLKMTIFGAGPGIVEELLLSLPFQVIRSLWHEYLVLPRDGAINFDSALTKFKATVSSMFGSLPIMRGRFAFFPPDLRNPIMEAGHRMTLLRIVYDGVEREVEPYSLAYKTRQDGVSREYLHVYDRTGGKSGPGRKNFVHPKIQSISNTDIGFDPQFEVELSRAGEYSKEQYFSSRRGATLPGLGVGVTYVIECPICGKRFRRKRLSTSLNPHRGPYGTRCAGRVGVLVAG
jgi:predicted nucleotidyltransferase component of viral defense system